VGSIDFGQEDRGVVDTGWAVGQREKDTGPSADRRGAGSLGLMMESLGTDY